MIPDLSNPQSWNRYSYVTNRPTNTNDPTGHWPNCKPNTHCPPKGDKRDITKWLVITAVDIAESSEMQTITNLNLLAISSDTSGLSKAAAYVEFYSLVSDGAKYDVKDNILTELGESTKIGKKWYEYSTAGNILYGFYGKAAGFSEYELRYGAGIAQKQDYKRDPKSGIGDESTFYDTPEDYYAVGFGFFLYDEYYKPNGKLTTTDLLDAFDRYKDADKMDLTSPRNFTPRYTEYSPSHFYNME